MAEDVLVLLAGLLLLSMLIYFCARRTSGR